jgi:hypothetical protein
MQKPKKGEEEVPVGKTLKKHLNIVFCGHVDAGKSTISGHLMYLTGQVFFSLVFHQRTRYVLDGTGLGGWVGGKEGGREGGRECEREWRGERAKGACI